MRLRPGFAFVVGAAFVACSSSSSTSTPDGTNPEQTAPQMQTVGAAGGAITAAGVTLTIPAGALPADTIISITPNAAAIPDGYTGLSQLYAFGPDGTVFLKPVAITFMASGADAASPVYWSNAAGGYDALDSTSSATGVSASILHFSRGFVGRKEAPPPPSTDAGPDTGSDSATDAAPSGDAGPSAGSITATVDGVSTLFATNATVTLGTGTTTIKADDNATTTHWTIQMVMTGIMQESCQLNGNPYMNYTHYTGGAVDKMYASKASGGMCLITLSKNPVTIGDHATGGFTATVETLNALPADPTTHGFTGATFDLTL